jgi:hypothetical protein
MRANTSAIDFGACDELLDSSSDALMVKVRAELQPGSTRRVQFPRDCNPSPTGHRGHARFRLPRSNRHEGHSARSRRQRHGADITQSAGYDRQQAAGTKPVAPERSLSAVIQSSVSRAGVVRCDSTTPTNKRKPPGKKYYCMHASGPGQGVLTGTSNPRLHCLFNVFNLHFTCGQS